VLLLLNQTLPFDYSFSSSSSSSSALCFSFTRAACCCVALSLSRASCRAELALLDGPAAAKLLKAANDFKAALLRYAPPPGATAEEGAAEGADAAKAPAVEDKEPKRARTAP
jgi:hypothetical protein